MSTSVEVITTGRPDLCAYAASRGYLTGSRLDDLPKHERAGLGVDFIDVHWESPDWPAMHAAVERHEPAYAIAGDYDGQNYAEVNERAAALRDHAENVIVVPHSPGEVDRVPEWAVVGYSTPTKYAGTDAPVWEYRASGHDVHILGGTPHGQLDLLGYLGDVVVSMDCNSHHKAATIGAKAWQRTRPHWQKVEGESAVERAYRESIDNLRAEYQQRGLFA